MHFDETRAGLCASVVCMLFLPFVPQIAFATEPPDACSLLSTQEVATALGVEVDSGTKIAPGACRWIGRAKRPGDDVATLRINFTTARSFEIGRTPLSGYTKTPESGIGDDAYSVDREGHDPTLSVKKGSAIVIIFVAIPKASLEQTKAAERKVALKLVEKL
jgi:hypothetical protein